MTRTSEQQARADEQRNEQMINLLSQIAENTKNTIGGPSGGPGVAGGQSTGTAVEGGKTRRVGQPNTGPDAGNGLLAGLGGPAAIAAQVGGGVEKFLTGPIRRVYAQSLGQGFSDSVNFGQGFGEARQGALNENKSALPVVGKGVARVIDPIKAAGARTSAITGLIARGGGVVSDEDRKALFERNLAEEKRAEKETFKVEKLTKSEIASDRTTADVEAAINRGFDRMLAILSGIVGG